MILGYKFPIALGCTVYESQTPKHIRLLRIINDLLDTI